MSYSIGGPGDYSTAPYLADEDRADRAQSLREDIINDFQRLRSLVWRYFETDPANAYAAVTEWVMANIDIDDESSLSRALSELVDEQVIKELEDAA